MNVAVRADQLLREALDHAAHLLPSQNPLDRFVHHNPLHAFEHLPFEEGVLEASAVYGARPFLPESFYREAWEQGRVLEADLKEAIEATVKPGILAGGVQQRALMRALMLHPIAPLSGERLAWTLTETNALRGPRPDLSPAARASLLAEAGGDGRRAIRRLWDCCEARRAELPAPLPPCGGGALRPRDVLLERLGEDPDLLVEPVLIRWAAAYLDNGVAPWPMHEREQGFWACFRDQHRPAGPLARPLRRLLAEARGQRWTAEQAALAMLEQVGVDEASWGDFILATLLATRGWSGMFARLRERPDTAPELRLPTELVEVLAVRLVLDLAAAEHLLADRGPRGTLLARMGSLPAPAQPAGPDPAWVLFQVAQLLGLGANLLGDLSTEALVGLMGEVWALDELTRRRAWQRAYERRHRVSVLDALAAHVRRGPVPTAPPRVRCVFCIDDREESLRRHLEELAPWVETLGFAGNYGISMYYRGLEHGHPVALGPAGFEPGHLVVERRADGQPARSGALKGHLLHHLDVGGQTMMAGALVALGGWLDSLPLSAQLLAPRVHARLTKRPREEDTDLELDLAEAVDDHGLQRGFTLGEMCDIAEGTLRAMGLINDPGGLVCCFGHGSHSMNNPHEAAHDCGACGGGRGGPNARVFARFANDPRVRAELLTRGVTLGERCWFVGAYHDTADDHVEWYDLDRVPEALKGDLADTMEVMERARTLDAHERCRRFHSAPLSLSPAQALAHVEARAEDIGQPRPEYGHATNALCFVGRRAWSRGLFLDRRAFLVSYDPDTDTDGEVLGKLLNVAVPVGAGISLEYWFSYVDPKRYGCDTKLPHNITGLIGVMDGASSDLRTGLPWQMVEIHEPVRLLSVVEASPERLLQIAERYPDVGRLVGNEWVQLVSLDPATGALYAFEDGGFKPYTPSPGFTLPRVDDSRSWYGGARGHLPIARVEPTGARS